MPDLKRYREKRDPNATPEPLGAEAEARALPPGAARAFVIQQHAARSMHWDFRIEIDGVLVSFAIPKGPTLDSREKRFAAQTEDHPLEYADFEGIIPAGNYGAGAMIVWDRGSDSRRGGGRARAPGRGAAARAARGGAGSDVGRDRGSGVHARRLALRAEVRRRARACGEGARRIHASGRAQRPRRDSDLPGDHA